MSLFNKVAGFAHVLGEKDLADAVLEYRPIYVSDKHLCFNFFLFSYRMPSYHFLLDLLNFLPLFCVITIGKQDSNNLGTKILSGKKNRE